METIFFLISSKKKNFCTFPTFILYKHVGLHIFENTVLRRRQKETRPSFEDQIHVILVPHFSSAFT